MSDGRCGREGVSVPSQLHARGRLHDSHTDLVKSSTRPAPPLPAQPCLILFLLASPQDVLAAPIDTQDLVFLSHPDHSLFLWCFLRPLTSRLSCLSMTTYKHCLASPSPSLSLTALPSSSLPSLHLLPLASLSLRRLFSVCPFLPSSFRHYSSFFLAPHCPPHTLLLTLPLRLAKTPP